MSFSTSYCLFLMVTSHLVDTAPLTTKPLRVHQHSLRHFLPSVLLGDVFVEAGTSEDTRDHKHVHDQQCPVGGNHLDEVTNVEWQ